MLWAGVVGSLAVFSSAAAVPDDAALLRAHRPELRYDRSERHFPASVASGLGTAQPSGAAAKPVVYGRAVQRPGGGHWLQYWLFYRDNPQDRGVLRIGRHEGDWELVQLRVDARGRPQQATLRAHTWAQGCRWSELLRSRAGAAIVFVANGSHANYSRPGVHDRPWPDPNDEADGRGRALRPPVEPIGDTAPSWVAWPGRFGDSEASWVPGEQSSPRGPAFQDAWSDPARLEREARSCTSPPPGRVWQAPVTIGLLAVPVVLLVAWARRRRRAFHPR